MQIQVNTDHTIPGREALIDGVASTVEERLSRYADRITRVEVHLSDESADEGKRCMIEVRPNGLDPVSATAQAASIDQAVGAATSKAITVLERTFGKLTSRKGH